MTELMRTTDQFVNAKMVRDVLPCIVPEGVPITSIFICNLRNKIRMTIQNGSDETGEQLVRESIHGLLESPTSTESELLSLDELPVQYIDSASRDARAVLRQALKETGDAARIEFLLKTMVKKENGFQYKVATDKLGRRCGYVWMTPWQRAAFEQYGDVIFLDCMKRKQNSVDWPYIGPVVLDGDNKIIVIVESIICSERMEAYEFILNAAFEFTPQRPRSSVKVIYGDGIMSDRLLVNLGIADSCKLCLDTYHLLHVDWPRKFGIQLFSSLQATFQSLVYTATEEDYLKNFAILTNALVAKPNLLKYLNDEIHANRRKFSRCFVLTYEGMKLCFYQNVGDSLPYRY